MKLFNAIISNDLSDCIDTVKEKVSRSTNAREMSP